MRRVQLALLVLSLAGGTRASAQVRVNPTGVNVDIMHATTVFLTFGGLRPGLRPAEAYWCGELVPAAPDVGMRCAPGTIYGQLPARYDLSRPSGTAGFTDIMSIPASVGRRAYLDARFGARASFFYVRRFVDVATGRDEFVAVTCRPSAGGARTPFALTNVDVRFNGEHEVQFIPSQQVLPPFAARIQYHGTGRLIGRWEVVLPGEEGPSELDLLPQASLPLEERTAQRRFTQVQRFNVFAPPGGTVTLPGPDPARLPTSAEGAYLVLLRIEATDDREGDSNLASVGAGSEIVHSGAVAGFPMPVLRYVVASDGATTGRSGEPRLTALTPSDGARLSPDSSLRLTWSGERGAAYYRLEIETPHGAPLLRALLPSPVNQYLVPAAMVRRTGGVTRWRVWALDANGRQLRRTNWRLVTQSPAG